MLSATQVTRRSVAFSPTEPSVPTVVRGHIHSAIFDTQKLNIGAPHMKRDSGGIHPQRSRSAQSHPCAPWSLWGVTLLLELLT